MAGEWETSRLGDCVTHQKGFAFKSADYRPSGHPIIRVSNFTDRSIDIAECSYLDHGAVQQHEAYKLRHRDAVIATVGSWPTNPASVVGKTICVPEKAEAALLNQNAVRLRGKPNLDQRFLFYLLKQPDFQTYIVGTAQGSASQASITLNDIFGFEFQRPSLAEQKAIAAVLGALDDKIELNRRMNATLEAMARALFQSWFVDFDPVRAKLDGRLPAKLDAITAALFPAKFQDSPLGPIPLGWTADTIKNRASNIQYGFTQSATKEQIGPHFLRITDISGGKVDWASVPFCQATNEEREKYRILDGDICIARTGASTGDNIYVVEPPPAVFASYLIRIQFSSRGVGRLVGEFTRTQDYASHVASMIGGSAQPNASAQALAAASMVFPPEEIADAFYRTVRPFDLMRAANDRESRTLATLRDTLLPKLLSGELSTARTQIRSTHD